MTQEAPQLPKALSEHQLDNLTLDRLGMVLMDSGDPLRYAPILYAAAKIIFEKHPGCAFMQDMEAAYSPVGSPWGHQVTTSEDWMIFWCRRHAENDEGRIWGAAPHILERLRAVVRALVKCGIDMGVLRLATKEIAFAGWDVVTEEEQERVNAVEDELSLHA